MEEIIKKVVRQGNSDYIRLSVPVKAVSGIKRGDYVAISCSSGRIVIRKLKDSEINNK